MRKRLLVDRLIGALRGLFETVGDPRAGRNTQLRFEDILMAAFSVFFMQAPSFLEHQRMFERSRGRNAAGSLFGIGRLPTDNHIRFQLDRIESAEIYAGFDIPLGIMTEYQALEPYQALGGRTLIALDGSEFHNSRKIHCQHCQTRLRNKGKDSEHTEYYHSVLAAALVGPGHPHALPLRPEFISPQDGDRKQDCETKAGYRWLRGNAARYAALSPVYLGDDLYAKQPMCRLVLEAGADFIFRVKTDDHKTLFEYLAGMDWPRRTVEQRTPRGRPNKEFHYLWSSCKLPLAGGSNPLQVYYAELQIKNAGARKPTAIYRFVTSIRPGPHNVAEIVACGRTRWKIENETFNILKNQGCHIEHNFGHGENGLSNTLLTLNLLAFTFHAVCFQLCALWLAAQRQCCRRRRFFLTLDLFTQYEHFGSWRALLSAVAHPEQRPLARSRAPP